MRTTFNPAQADLFGARDLHLAALPAMSAGEEQVNRLRRELTAAREDLARVTQQAKYDVLNLERKIADQSGEILRLKEEATRLRWERLNRRIPPTSCAIPKPTWRLLMQLVHPDKHDGSAASLAAAKWLNENKPE